MTVSTDCHRGIIDRPTKLSLLIHMLLILTLVLESSGMVDTIVVVSIHVANIGIPIMINILASIVVALIEQVITPASP